MVTALGLNTKAKVEKIQKGKVYHLVGCIAECMLRCGEDNHHVHNVNNGYEEEMALSSDVNDTDEDESKKSIVHEPFDELSSENLYIDVSESE